EGEWELEPNDDLYLGRTHLLFVEDMNQLPDLPQRPESEGVSIKKRLGQTRFLTPPPPPRTPAEEEGDGGPTHAHLGPRHALSRAVALLSRGAGDRGWASSSEELCRIVLAPLLGPTPAEVGAILSVRSPAPGRQAGGRDGRAGPGEPARGD